MNNDISDMKSPIVLTRQTAVSIGLLAILLVPALFVNNKLSSMQYELQSLSKEIVELRVISERAAEDRWRRVDMKNWVKVLKAQNPDLKVPEVD